MPFHAIEDDPTHSEEQALVQAGTDTAAEPTGTWGETDRGVHW